MIGNKYITIPRKFSKKYLKYSKKFCYICKKHISGSLNEVLTTR